MQTVVDSQTNDGIMLSHAKSLLGRNKTENSEKTLTRNNSSSNLLKNIEMIEIDTNKTDKKPNEPRAPKHSENSKISNSNADNEERLLNSAQRKLNAPVVSGESGSSVKKIINSNNKDMQVVNNPVNKDMQVVNKPASNANKNSSVQDKEVPSAAVPVEPKQNNKKTAVNPETLEFLKIISKLPQKDKKAFSEDYSLNGTEAAILNKVNGVDNKKVLYFEDLGIQDSNTQNVISTIAEGYIKDYNRYIKDYNTSSDEMLSAVEREQGWRGKAREDFESLNENDTRTLEDAKSSRESAKELFKEAKGDLNVARKEMEERWGPLFTALYEYIFQGFSEEKKALDEAKVLDLHTKNCVRKAASSLAYNADRYREDFSSSLARENKEIQNGAGGFSAQNLIKVKATKDFVTTGECNTTDLEKAKNNAVAFQQTRDKKQSQSL